MPPQQLSMLGSTNSIDGFVEMLGTFLADPARAMEFLDVERASSGGLTLTGSGTTTVDTAPLFSPGQTVWVIDNADAAQDVSADSDGRISFTAALGSAHAAQQYTAEALALASQPDYFTTRTIRFSPVH